VSWTFSAGLVLALPVYAVMDFGIITCLIVWGSSAGLCLCLELPPPSIIMIVGECDDGFCLMVSRVCLQRRKQTVKMEGDMINPAASPEGGPPEKVSPSPSPLFHGPSDCPSSGANDPKRHSIFHPRSKALLQILFQVPTNMDSDTRFRRIVPIANSFWNNPPAHP
jgi:hypothetical protein